MKKPATRRKKKNPPSVIESPLRDWVFNGHLVTTVTLPLDSGEHLSVILEDPDTRATARTKQQAELAALRLYEQNSREPNPVDEDERDYAIHQARLKEPRVPWREIKKKLRLK